MYLSLETLTILELKRKMQVTFTAKHRYGLIASRGYNVTVTRGCDLGDVH